MLARDSEAALQPVLSPPPLDLFPSFLQESLSRSVLCALIWSAIILSNGMCVAISMFQFTFGRRGTSGAMSAGKIKKLFAFVT